LLDKQWKGYENIMFTATDPSGGFDVKMAVFTVQESGFVYDLNNNGLIDIEDMIMVLQLFTRIHVDKQWIPSLGKRFYFWSPLQSSKYDRCRVYQTYCPNLMRPNDNVLWFHLN
jgi:hypothetical protein